MREYCNILMSVVKLRHSLAPLTFDLTLIFLTISSGNHFSFTVLLVSMQPQSAPMFRGISCRFIVQCHTIQLRMQQYSISRNVCLKLMTLSQPNWAKWICGLSYTRWLGLNVGLYVNPAAMTWLIHNAIRLHHLVPIARIDVRLHGTQIATVVEVIGCEN